MENAPLRKPMRKLLPLLGALVVLGAVLAYFAGAFHPNVAPDQAVASNDLDGEEVMVSVRHEPMIETVPGTIRAADETVVGARIMANVVRVTVRAGDRVTEGQLLVELDRAALQAALEQRTQLVAAARASFEDAQLTRNRVGQLFEKGSASKAEYDRAETDYRKAVAEFERAQRAVAEAEASVAYTRIAAPMNATVVDRLVEAGDTVAPGQGVVKLFYPGRLRIEATLRESLIGFVSIGDALGALIDAHGERVQVVVEEIVPSADPGSRTFVLKARLPALERIFPGMFARLEVPVGTQRSLVVPASAVHSSGQLHYVYVVRDGTSRRRFVRPGSPSADGHLEIRSGLDEGEVVLVQALEATD
jgi:RND family efflux transporter MFP subunit